MIGAVTVMGINRCLLVFLGAIGRSRVALLVVTGCRWSGSLRRGSWRRGQVVDSRR